MYWRVNMCQISVSFLWPMATCFGIIYKPLSCSARKQNYNRQHAYRMFKVEIFKLQCRKSNVCTVTSVSDYRYISKWILCSVDRASRYIYVIKTNLMHHLSSVYFVSQPLHVSGIFVAHHQEVYCIYTTIGAYCAFSWLSVVRVGMEHFHPNSDSQL